MHFTFAIPAKGTLDLNVVLQDTMMMNQELKPRNAFMINDIEDESRELVFSYKL
jgi:CTP-dependent riboflavin kinase